MKLTLPVPLQFNFWRTVYSHGWCSLPPFEVRKEDARLRRVLELSGGKTVLAEIYQSSRAALTIEVSNGSLSEAERGALLENIKTCLRLHEDYAEFYIKARRHPEFRWIPKMGAGRLLRAPTVFEDVVKMMCTTNCSWALTEVMVGNLCGKLGRRVDGSRCAFPVAEAIADCSEKFLRKEIRAGYRAPYLLELSKRISKGELDIEQWRRSALSTNELYEEARSIKGIGPYAAGNILKLLGRYDYLGIDSWCRKKFSEIHRNGRKIGDKAIERHYEPFDEWKGLFFWLDVTRDWYKKRFPF